MLNNLIYPMQIYYVYMAVFPLICLSLMMVKTVAQHKKEFIEKHGYPGGGGVPGAILLPLQLQGQCVIGGMPYEDWERLKNSSDIDWHTLPQPVYDTETYCNSCGVEGKSYCNDCPLPPELASGYIHQVLAQWKRAARVVNNGESSDSILQHAFTAMPNPPLIPSDWVLAILNPYLTTGLFTVGDVQELLNELPMSQNVPRDHPGIGFYSMNMGKFGTYYVEYVLAEHQATFKAPLRLPAINTDQAEVTAINTVAEVKVPLTKKQQMKENQKLLSPHRRR
jgi:hypothetical protein